MYPGLHDDLVSRIKDINIENINHAFVTTTVMHKKRTRANFAIEQQQQTYPK